MKPFRSRSRLEGDVYAGTTNLTGQIDVEVTAIAGETTIGKVESLIREAESSKTQRQEFIEQLASYYFWVVLMVAALVWFFTTRSADEAIRDQAAIRAITVLVVTCPGGLLISHPTAMVAAFAASARVGIMIKQTRTLEAAANIDTIIMDKTGTLTDRSLRGQSAGTCRRDQWSRSPASRGGRRTAFEPPAGSIDHGDRDEGTDRSGRHRLL